MNIDNNQEAFFELVRAGLWEQKVRLSQFDKIDYSEVLRLAEEQSVIGLVATGLYYVEDVRVPKKELLQFVGYALQLEHQNKGMNKFIADLVEKMRRAGIYTLLVKGQGVAQCYERPLWRASGDVDFLLSKDNYDKAKTFLCSMASMIDEENDYSQHLGMIIDSWPVELHGNLHSGLSRRIDRVLDEMQCDLFYGGNVRSWQNGSTQIFLPGVNDDVVFIFSHILQHFFKGGIGLRQVGDWCRILWTYRDVIDRNLLENRLRKMGLMTEWKAFGLLAVNTLGMPEEAMPFYSKSAKWQRKADNILAFILETGNFGHNRDKSYYEKHSFVVYKAISWGLYTKDSIKHFFIFPKDATLVWFRRLQDSITAALKKSNRFCLSA